ncbi:hypothetical protein AWC18_11025 [Mycolicibacter nonchromogenicus]|uniref:DUF732 domain-containing protein n=1 Tax=Mycolicibacter nonchromogenicus TaxID=1782 RepID=A0A1X1ZBC7_MYCNO|nr:hypothetical protein [Mycolicibacter nonchromogenicus]OBI03092.1 hypothetical protein A5715_09365 [Mycolicibacter heraklionensis]ORW20632.1 hypothetical protein AWC18_11025 [Mycolicibacter nonchromogenicus]
MGKMAWCAAVLCGLPVGLVLSIPAHANGDQIGDYVADHGGDVCALIKDQPNLVGVKLAVSHILATSGLPADQTGRLLAGSVRADCPEDGALVDEFVWYEKRRQQSNTGVGATLGN